MAWQLIADVHLWHRLWSMRLAIATAVWAALVATWVGTPDAWHPHLPEWVKFAVLGTGTLTAAATPIARIVRQASLEPATFTPTTPAPLKDAQP